MDAVAANPFSFHITPFAKQQSARIKSLPGTISLPFACASKNGADRILPIRAKFRVVTIHDVFHLAFYDTLNFMQKIYAKTILNQALSRSDIVLSVSNFSRSEILKYTKTDKNIF